MVPPVTASPPKARPTLSSGPVARSGAKANTVDGVTVAALPNAAPAFETASRITDVEADENVCWVHARKASFFESIASPGFAKTVGESEMDEGAEKLVPAFVERDHLRTGEPETSNQATTRCPLASATMFGSTAAPPVPFTAAGAENVAPPSVERVK